MGAAMFGPPMLYGWNVFRKNIDLRQGADAPLTDCSLRSPI
jgi:hypothetical protein